MTIRRVGRDAARLETLSLFSAITSDGTARLDDLTARQAFLDRVASGLEEAISAESTLHGWRVQSLFETMLVGLGAFRLLKEEDAGNTYFAGEEREAKPPDFRVIDLAGEEVLIEVKAVPPGELVPARMSAGELRALKRYADITDRPLLLAHYWAAINRWTLVGPEHTQEDNRHVEIDPVVALTENELGRFGDAMIGTRPPISLTLSVEPLGQKPETTAAPYTRQVRITDKALAVDGAPITDADEERIAMFLMPYGGWDAQQTMRTTDDGEPAAIEFHHWPVEEAREAVEKQGFATVGMLSSMFSSFYNASTLDDGGRVQRLRRDAEPGLLANLIPENYWDRPDRALKLWRLELRPRSK